MVLMSSDGKLSPNISNGSMCSRARTRQIPSSVKNYIVSCTVSLSDSFSDMNHYCPVCQFMQLFMHAMILL